MITSLDVDGNWLLESQFAVYAARNTVNNVPAEMYVNDLFKQIHSTFIANVVKLNGAVTHLTVVADGRDSWRKTYTPLHKQIADPFALAGDAVTEYKDNRVKDVNIDWAGIYAAYDKWLACLPAHNVRTLRCRGAEGDDLLQMCTDHDFKLGRSSLIMTSDKDMTQTIQHNEDAHVSFYKRSQRKTAGRMQSYYTLVTTCDAFVKDNVGFLDVPKFMLHNNIACTTILQACEAKQIEYPATFMMYKAFMGDAGDVVGEVIYKHAGKISPKSGKPRINHTTGSHVHKALVEYVGEDYGNILTHEHVYDNELMTKIGLSIYCQLYKVGLDQVTDNIKEYVKLKVQDNVNLMHLHETTKRPQQLIDDVNAMLNSSTYEPYKSSILDIAAVIESANITDSNSFMSIYG